ncbi:YegS/Rv2252/BmrU family lipid kinase [Patulibacter sp. SYSU D01012]|uniref:diacylglycerol/lipid kinase family protein n=1 Tax=Patulibacter sp. SYSU D01012 TaxID=2817381 RepID=UPI001B3108D5
MRGRSSDARPVVDAPVTPAPVRSFVLLVNPTAGGGRGRHAGDAAAARLRARGARFRTIVAASAEAATAAAIAAIDAGDVPVAVGGDGTLRLVADAALGRPGAVVGLVPGGRGNDVARHLGLPADPAAAADALVDGDAVPVDAGVAVAGDGTRRSFLSVACVGFDAEANRIADAAPARLGRFAYVWGALGALAGLRPTDFAIEVDGTPVAQRALLVAVGNAGSYGGGMRIAPHSSVADGVFDVVAVGHTGRRPDACGWRDRLRIVHLLPAVFRGSHVRMPSVSVRRAAQVRIAADAPLLAYADGDPIGPLPMTLSTVPAALSLLVPPGHRAPALEVGR